jgi:molybdenum cofactor biosynthesis enzyme MoaA
VIIPSVVYCPTDRCDMRCEYCPTEGGGSYGENFEISRDPLGVDDAVWVVNAIGRLGFSAFRLTGGEPLLNTTRAAGILEGVVKAGVYSNVRLNTNGSRLKDAAAALAPIPLTAVKVSLDTLDPELFEKITKSRKHSDVVLGIELAKAAGLPVEVNAVLTRQTASGIMALVHWCMERDIHLKILDLVQYDSQQPGYIKGEKAISAEVDAQLRAAFGQPVVVQLSNNRGIYMKRYGAKPFVVFKDCDEGTTYTNYCHGCTHYPCEEGIHHLSISADGHLRPCRIRNNCYWDLQPIIRDRDSARLTELVEFMLRHYYSGEFSLPYGTAPPKGDGLVRLTP